MQGVSGHFLKEREIIYRYKRKGYEFLTVSVSLTTKKGHTAIVFFFYASRITGSIARYFSTLMITHRTSELERAGLASNSSVSSHIQRLCNSLKSTV